MEETGLVLVVLVGLLERLLLYFRGVGVGGLDFWGVSGVVLAEFYECFRFFEAGLCYCAGLLLRVKATGRNFNVSVQTVAGLLVAVRWSHDYFIYFQSELSNLSNTNNIISTAFKLIAVFSSTMRITH